MARTAQVTVSTDRAGDRSRYAHGLKPSDFVWHPGLLKRAHACFCCGRPTMSEVVGRPACRVCVVQGFYPDPLSPVMDARCLSHHRVVEST